MKAAGVFLVTPCAYPHPPAMLTTTQNLPKQKSPKLTHYIEGKIMPMSDAQKKAAGDRMRAMHAAKIAKKIAEAEQASQEEAMETPSLSSAATQPKDPGPSREEYDDLLKLVKQLTSAAESKFSQTPSATEAPIVTARGLVGEFEKYLVDPEYYPNPVARLTAEPRLARFAFPMNYELDWAVSTTSYETKTGINTKEPRFNLELRRIVMDEDTGEQTNGRYVVCKMMFHEDPQAALVVARENGVEINDYNERDFLNEMRYLRMKAWLLEAFYPPKADNVKVNRRDGVIGNKLVEIFEINSEDPQSVFNKLK